MNKQELIELVGINNTFTIAGENYRIENRSKWLRSEVDGFYYGCDMFWSRDFLKTLSPQDIVLN